MVIEFENSLEDVLALNMYHYEQSPGARRVRRLLQFGPAAILVLIFLAQIVFSGASPISALPWLMFAVVWTVFVPYMLRRSMRKRVLQLYSGGRDKGIVGKHTLSLTSSGVTDKTGYGKTETAWRDVLKMIATTQYVFIYVSDTAAHIVPVRAFPDEIKFREFRDTVIRHLKATSDS